MMPKKWDRLRIVEPLPEYTRTQLYDTVIYLGGETIYNIELPNGETECFAAEHFDVLVEEPHTVYHENEYAMVVNHKHLDDVETAPRGTLVFVKRIGKPDKHGRPLTCAVGHNTYMLYWFNLKKCTVGTRVMLKGDAECKVREITGCHAEEQIVKLDDGSYVAIKDIIFCDDEFANIHEEPASEWGDGWEE